MKINKETFGVEHYRKQQRGYTCAQACILMACSWFKCPELHTEKELGIIGEVCRKKGTTRENVIKSLSLYGLNSRPQYDGTLDGVKKDLDEGNVVIALFWSKAIDGDGVDCFHYALIADVDEKEVFTIDPWTGEPWTYTREEFEKYWYCENDRNCWYVAVNK